MRWGGTGAVAALLAGSFGSIGSNAIVVEHRELRLPRWDADGFRIAVLTDLHANDMASGARAKKAIRLALEQKPDLIAITGDYLNFSWSYVVDNMIEALRDLHDATCPVLGVLGNHDYWTEQPHDVIEAIRKRTAIRMLRNEAAEVDGVTVAGLDDALVKRHRPEFIGALKNRSVLALLHEPDFVTELPQNASLQISGHSHGGQMCLPGGIPLNTPRGAWRYIKGFYREANVPLYVSRGIGTVGPPMRTFCPPEVSLLTLRSAV
jgi:predicted MPP superfamily phosphohydrolase